MTSCKRWAGWALFSLLLAIDWGCSHSQRPYQSCGLYAYLATVDTEQELSELFAEIPVPQWRGPGTYCLPE